MVNETYCEYEVARKLKDAGFPLEWDNTDGIRYYYDKDGNCKTREQIEVVDEESLCPCPTQDVARHWLQTQYNIFIGIEYLSFSIRPLWRYTVVLVTQGMGRNKKYRRDSAMEDFDIVLGKAIEYACEIILGRNNQAWKDELTFVEAEPATEIRHLDIFATSLTKEMIVSELAQKRPLGRCPECSTEFESVIVEKYDNIRPLSGSAGYRICCAKCGEVIATIVRCMS